MLRTLFVAVFFTAFISCDDGLVKSEYKATSGGAWQKDDIFEFNFSKIDTLRPHNLFINVRNDETYPYNNLFLIAELSGPDGMPVIDTLEYEMARPDGSWLGKGYGSIKENMLWYKENIVFPSSGVYTLRLSHAMRKNGDVNGVEALTGITDVGYEILKSNQ
tara:strand:- start:493 stop:978 length:486 start_codon:yes stop_codon:yes gene_type:complete